MRRSQTTPDELPSREAMFWRPGAEVTFDPGLDTWHAFAHADVLRILNDKAVFSSGYGWTDEDREHVNPGMVGMWAADGQRHTDLRSAVAQPFRREVMARLADDVRTIATGLIDEVIAEGPGTVDIVQAFARPLPSRVICRVLGLDISHAERMHAWLDEAYEVTTATHMMPRQQDQADFFQELIDTRRAAPQLGLVDDLIAAQAAGYQVDGRPMTDWDLVGYFAMMLAAGVDTTAASLGNALLFLTEYGHWDELRADPALIPSAVEETLRWYPAFPGVRRLVLTDTVLDGRQLTAGQWATGWLTSANRDPVRFPDPDTFDIRRAPNPHLSLGSGRHHCLGAPLARMELRVFLEEAVRRLPGLRRDTGKPITRRQWLVDALDEAHFTFQGDPNGHRPAR